LIHAAPLRLTLSAGLWQQQTAIDVEVQIFRNWEEFFKTSVVKCSKLTEAPDIFVCDLAFLTAVNIKI
jgi:hypothetical protein